MISIKKIFWFCNSLLNKIILRLNGVHVGSKFYIEGIIKLKIRGKGSNIEIGDNVSVFGNIDLRNRENGRIIIESNVKFDCNVRIVSARDGNH